MTTTLANRLNQILPHVTSEDFLSSEGIGNEIACYIFDYPAQGELQVREYIQMLLGRFASHHSELRVLHLDLLDVVLAYLNQRGLFDKALKMEANEDAPRFRESNPPSSCSFSTSRRREVARY
jgi:hypothetical protein